MFSNGSVFGNRFRPCSVDDSRIQCKAGQTAPFSFENGLVWMGPNMDLSLSGQTSIFGGVFFVFKSLLGIERQN